MQAGQDTQNFPVNGHYPPESVSARTSGDEGNEEKPKGGLKIRPIIALLVRNLPIIVTFAAIGGGLGFFAMKNTPLTFEGDFTILVEPITSQGRATDPTAISRAEGGGVDGTSVDYPTLLQVLQSPTLLSKIADQIHPRFEEVSAASLARDIRNQDLVIARIGETSIDYTRTIQVTYQGTDPNLVQYTLEKIAEGYLRFSLDDRKTRIGGGVEFIEDQLPSLQQRVTDLESQVQIIRQKYRFTNPSIENEEVVKQLKDVQQQRLQTEAALKEQQTLFASVQAQLGLNPDQGLAANSLSQNPRFQDLLAQRQKIQSQIQIGLARFTEDSPTIQRLRNQEQNLNRLIGQQTRTILSQTSPGVTETGEITAFQDPLRVSLISQLVTSSNQAKALEARMELIVRTEKALDERLTQLPVIVRQYNTLQQQLDIATKTLNQFLLQLQTLRVEAAQKEVPWEIISKPKLLAGENGKPIAKRSKKAQQLIFMGAGAGLALGLILSLLLEKLKNSFATAEDLQDAVQQPFLGSIPRRPTDQQMASWNGKASQRLAAFQDSFNTLYANLRFLNPKLVHSVAVTSAEGGDGKTLVAMNLAQTAASLGQRVLLIDANLINPQLHQLLDLPNQHGLMDVLQQKLDVEDVIQPLPLDSQLSVITTGSVYPGVTRLFASSEMRRMLSRLRKTFDLVILDAPALDGLTDLNFLGAQVEGFLMVAGIKKTKRSTFKRNMDGLNKYNIPVIGIVANHLPSKHDSSYPIAKQSMVGGATEMPSAFLGNLKETTEVTR